MWWSCRFHIKMDRVRKSGRRLFSRTTPTIKQLALAYDIFSNPFRPVTLDSTWLTSSVRKLGKAGYDDRTFDRLPILADALEEAGCTSSEMLDHFRSGGEHVRGCWALDLILEKQ